MHVHLMFVHLLLRAIFDRVRYPHAGMAVTGQGTYAEGTDSEPTYAERWHELLDSHARVSGALERALQSEHGLGVSEFEVLDRLATGDKDQRRMQELADSVHLSQSALSRLIGRLEAEGLVSRAICSNDRRGIFACLTDAGRARHGAALPTQRRVLEDQLG
jgi:DNA-binding MarR family transcriptional regulator